VEFDKKEDLNLSSERKKPKNALAQFKEIDNE
jgi:hypothetical protein